MKEFPPTKDNKAIATQAFRDAPRWVGHFGSPCFLVTEVLISHEVVRLVFAEENEQPAPMLNSVAYSVGGRVAHPKKRPIL